MLNILKLVGTLALLTSVVSTMMFVAVASRRAKRIRAMDDSKDHQRERLLIDADQKLMFKLIGVDAFATVTLVVVVVLYFQSTA